jgi:lipopolysaccharide export system permease protein
VEDIYIYEFDPEQKLRVSTHALRGRYDEGRWLLEDIVQTDLTGEFVQRKSIQQAVWESLLKPELINIVVIKPNSLSIRDLIGYIRYLNSNAQNTLQYEQALWIKIIYPFACGIMVFLAIPMVLLGGSRTSSIGQRVVTGSVIGLVFHILNQASGHLGLLYELNPFFSAAAPTLLTLGTAVLLVRRIH